MRRRHPAQGARHACADRRGSVPRLDARSCGH